MLGTTGYQERGLKIATKLLPTKGRNMTWLFKDKFSHSAVDLRKGFSDSLAALKTDKIDLFYMCSRPQRPLRRSPPLGEKDAQRGALRALRTLQLFRSVRSARRTIGSFQLSTRACTTRSSTASRPSS